MKAIKYLGILIVCMPILFSCENKNNKLIDADKFISNLNNSDIQNNVKENDLADVHTMAKYLGVGIPYYYFCQTNGRYVCLKFDDYKSIAVQMPDGTIFHLPYVSSNQGWHIFGNSSNSSVVCMLTTDCKNMKVTIDDSNTYNCIIVGPATTYSQPVASQPYNSVPSYEGGEPSQNVMKKHRCTYCNGRGYVIGNKTPDYSGTKIYCQECNGTFPGTHSHDLCPSCGGTGECY